MRYREFCVDETRQVGLPLPSSVKRQQRINKVMAQLAANDVQQQPTEMDKVIAMRQHAHKQSLSDELYATRLKKLLAAAQ